MKNMLRKNWFVLTIAFLLLAFIGLFIYNDNKDKLAGKKVDNKDVVAVFNGKDIFADDVYQKAKQSQGAKIITMMIVKELVDQAIPDTDEIKQDIETQKNQIIANFKQKNPSGYETEIAEALQKVGFTNGFNDLEAYLKTNIKNQIMIENYVVSHADQYLASIDEKHGRTVSHILVKFPTLSDAEKAGKTAEEITYLQNQKNETEKANLDVKKAEIDKELQTKTFAEVAQKYTDDTASKATKGSLGYVNSDTSFVKEFLDASLSLNEGEVSDWVQTTYGFHKIKVDVVGRENLLALKDVRTQIINSIVQTDNTIYGLALKEMLEKYPVTTQDVDIQKAIDSLTK